MLLCHSTLSIHCTISWQGMREKGSCLFKPVSICHGRNHESKIHSYLSTIISLKSLRSEVVFEGSLGLKVRHCSESYITTLRQYWTGLLRSGIINSVFTPTWEEQSCHPWLSLGMLVTEKMSNSATSVKGWGGSYSLEPAPEKPLLLLSRELIQEPWNKQCHRTILQCHCFQNYHPAQLTANLLRSLV